MPYTDLCLDLTDDHLELRAAVHKFSTEVLRPTALKLDKMTPEQVIAADSPYWDCMRQMFELGYHTVHIPEEFGGMGLDPLAQHIFWEELAYGSAGFAISLGVSMFGPFMATMLPEEHIIDTVIKPFVECRDASILWCWAITEPKHGSDSITATSDTFHDPSIRQQLRAEKKGDRWILNGQKSAWVSNGPIATNAMLHVNTDPSMGMAGGGICLVDLTQKGVTKGKPLDKIGQRELPQGEIFFDDAEVPEEMMVIHGDGYDNMVEIVLSEANMHMGVNFTGVARAAYDLALKYSMERVQGGKRLCDHSAVKQRLFRMFTKVEAARSFSRAAMIYNLNQVPPDGKYNLASKVLATETAFDVCHEAVQLFGGYGLTKEYPIEKLFRDSRSSMIEDGSNDVLAITGADLITREHEA